MTITSEPARAESVAEAPLELVYEPREPVDWRATLGPLRRGPGDPCVRFDEAGTGVWLTLRTAEGAASLHISGTRGRVRARAWGSGASAALASVPELLGDGDDWSDLDLTAFELLESSRHRNPGLRLTRTARVLDSLAAAIIEQKVTSTEAFRAWRVLVTKHGERPPGPVPAALRVPLTAEQWRRIPSWEWHRAGVDPRRSKTVIGAATVASGLERTTSIGRGGAEVQRLLRTVTGVGVWTAAETSQRSHGDPDAVSFGDYHLAATIGWALVGEAIDDDALADLLAPWAGQRQRIVRLVLASGFRPPRHGPRMTIQDHRWH
ncbi:DNA-3-methyladenine glycosylase family protein [Herbiconiux daphne]|uniref:DNA-3-methyladenine glycosylase 2 family protein n=1 Tax=Herbiconiux daphne TaxID=2970914 RepID=A0ABT2H100_9MICO|nr:DNA-3-methyladenine glycosylase 2 family protein [Herbiconiux daphne]MCS5733619.1 DNA-3-methyladenine glycosylase 2 family protein [Herbiconiux daphne]